MRIRLKRDQLLSLLARTNRSQNHWAMVLGLSRGHWSDLVNGKHPYPSARTRERILEALGVPFDALFEVDDGASDLPDHDVQDAIGRRYLLDREVGQGGMGTVYLARDLTLGRSVAVKVISEEAVSGIGVRQFLKEIAQTTRLQHPHILPLLDAGAAAGSPYYVMPYVRDGSLRDLLERLGRLSVDEALAIAAGIAAALQHAHEEGVLHCDVKPANVLLSGRHPYLVDFGIARAIGQEAVGWAPRPAIDTSAGTPAYVSPEQAAGERLLDGRADVYSLACVVFELLCGRPPFEGATTLATVAQRFGGDIPRLDRVAPHVPRAIADAVARAMAVRREERTASAAELRGELGRAGAVRRSPVRERAGLAVARAAAAVRRAAGGLPMRRGTRPAHHASRGYHMLSSIRQDLTYGWRTLRRTPGYATVVTLTLAFAIAANATVFSLLNPYFVRPLPFTEPDRLVQIHQVDPVTGWDRARFSLPQFLDWQERTRAFDALAAYQYGRRNVTGPEGPERVMTGIATATMFSLLGTPPAAGRVFAADEDGPAGADVALVGYDLWRRRYGGDPSLVGRPIMIDGRAHTVVGIMPRRFVFPFGGVDLWVPIRRDGAADERGSTGFHIVGRLTDGWTAERARDELATIQLELATQYPEADGRFAGVTVVPLREALNFAWDVLRTTFTILLAAVGFVLLLACVNVASLTFARATSRTGEVAVRAALGAGRGRLVRQLLTESGLLAAAGATLGILAAFWASKLLGPVIPEDWYRVGEASVDPNVLAFTLFVTLGAVLLFGLTPALTATRANLGAALREGRRHGGSAGAMHLRRGLVVFQVVMAVVLISGMGLMVRSLVAARSAALGFQPDEVLVVEVTPPESDYPTSESVREYFERVRREVGSLPGVRRVATAVFLPLNNETATIQIARPGQEPAWPEDWPLAVATRVSPGYFDAMAIPVAAGRDFGPEDAPDAPTAVIVSRSVAERYWPGEPAVGRTILTGQPDEARRATIVGVVGEVRHQSIGVSEEPMVYYTTSQGGGRRQFVIVRGDADPRVLTSSVRQAMHLIDPTLPLTVRPLSSIVGERLLPWSLPSAVLTVLGGVGLLLASLGIYGLVAYSVAQRRREIGVRMALGATGDRIRRSFVGEGLRLGGIGISIGILAALVTGRLMASFLFGVGPFDAVTLFAVLFVFVAVATAASLVPARRASRVDPMTVLREL